jgi:hypothetical protein
MSESGNVEITPQFGKIYPWGEECNVEVLYVLCIIKLLHSV